MRLRRRPPVAGSPDWSGRRSDRGGAHRGGAGRRGVTIAPAASRARWRRMFRKPPWCSSNVRKTRCHSWALLWGRRGV